MIQKAEAKDLPMIAGLACQLWPDHTVEEMRAEFAEVIAKPDSAFFLAYVEDVPIGFAQCQLRYESAIETVISQCEMWTDNA